MHVGSGAQRMCTWVGEISVVFSAQVTRSVTQAAPLLGALTRDASPTAWKGHSTDPV